MEQIKTNLFSVKYLSIILAVITFAVYANTLQNGYVLDDGMVLRDNELVKQGIKAIPQILATPHTAGVNMSYQNDTYRPLSMVMFAAEVQFFGMNTFVGHLFNILVFIGCVLMLFFFSDRFFNHEKTGIAFIAALLFAVHPIHTEVVANIKSRDELLCYFFGFWSLCLFMAYMKSGRTSRLVMGAVTLFAAYLSKETVVAFLAIVPLLFFFYYNDNRKRAILITVWTTGATILFLTIRYAVLSKYHIDQLGGGKSFIDNALSGAPDTGTRAATTLLVLGKYLALLFLPYPLLSDYSFNSIPFTGFGNIWVVLSLVVYMLLGIWAASRLIKKKKDPWAFCILFYLITMFLFSNIPFLMGAELAERFLFFASTGFCIALALAIGQWANRANSGDPVSLKSSRLLIVLVPFLLVYSAVTMARNRDWKSSYTLYKTDLERSQNDSRLYYWLASEIAEHVYNDEKDTVRRRELDKESIEYLHTAIAIYPGYADAYAELGWIYERSHNYDSAFRYDNQAIQLDPYSSVANQNLGSVYYSVRKYPEAAELLKKAIALNPKYKIAYLTLANCYLQMKQYALAIADCEEVIAFAPDYADAYQAMGNAYLRMQNYAEAESRFKQVIALKPDYVLAINNLGVVYLNTKQFPLAIDQFKKAISLDPAYINAYSNLGRAYFFTQQYLQAIETIQKERGLEPENGADLPILALCYERLGNMPLAQRYEELAKQFYPDFKLQ